MLHWYPILVFAAGVALAQDATAPPAPASPGDATAPAASPEKKEPTATHIELTDGSNAAQGKTAEYIGEADQDGVALILDAHSILTPVAFLLATPDANSPVKIQVKNSWSTGWDKEFTTGADGTLTAKVRSEGPIAILVRGSGPDKTAFHLIVWVGPEFKLTKLMKPPFKPVPTRLLGWRRYSTWGIAALAALLVAVASIFLLARKRRTA